MDRALAMTRAAGISALFGATAIVAASCSGDQQPAVADAGSDAKIVAPYDAGPKTQLDAADDTPYYNSDGWVGLQGFDRACGIYVAPSPSAKNFPPPLTWEPCDARLHGMDGGAFVCRQIAGGTSYVASAYVDRATQAVTLPVLQTRGTQSLDMVVEADGPVHQAILSSPPRCDLGTFASVSSKTVIYMPEEFSPSLDIVLIGALGGPIDGTLKLLRVYNNVQSVGYVAGPSEFVEYGAAGFDTGAWSDGHRIDTISASGTGQLGELRFQSDNLFFSVNDLNFGRIELFQPGIGTIDFISFGDDPNHYAADLGTDGTDMVWTEASGHPGGESSPWTTINIISAPYTTNPAAIVKRRLRSEVRNLGDVPFTVGCGYAAHEISTVQGTGVRIVRISDGQSWLLLDSTSPVVTWVSAAAITCNEIFVNFNFGSSAQNLARIRLDSLGPGDPAD